jgi:HEAT repeat protein
MLADVQYDAVEGFYPEIVLRLGDESEAVRAAAVNALRSAGDERVASALFQAAVARALPQRERGLALRLAAAWARAG